MSQTSGKKTGRTKSRGGTKGAGKKRLSGKPRASAAGRKRGKIQKVDAQHGPVLHYTGPRVGGRNNPAGSYADDRGRSAGGYADDKGRSAGGYADGRSRSAGSYADIRSRSLHGGSYGSAKSENLRHARTKAGSGVRNRGKKERRNPEKRSEAAREAELSSFYKRLSLKKAIVIAVCLALSLILQLAARAFPAFAEFYAVYIYPLWVNTLGRLMSFFPVSVVEILLYLLILYAVFGIIKTVLFRKGMRKRLFVQGVLSFLTLASVLFFSYTAFCGINYHRHTFAEESGLTVKERPVEELIKLCEKLTAQVNEYSEKVVRNKRGLCVLETEAEQRAVKAMQAAAEEFEALSGYYPKPKGLIVSQILSYQQLTGIYSPFTIEANYNRHMTAYNKPFTMCHELSHLRGFMREDEANFIAYAACLHSEDIDFNYSGALTGWVYATNALYKEDKEAYERIYDCLSEDVIPDLNVNSRFWAEYEGKISEAADKINDTYLKANNQTDGVKSYSRMVDLMLAYEEKGGDSNDDIN